jgi:endo-1,4-beta-xylanase
MDSGFPADAILLVFRRRIIMLQKMKWFVAMLLVLGICTNAAMGELIGYWPFDEGRGTTTSDVTGNGNYGTFNGNVEWMPGYKDSAVHFDTAGERVVIGSLDPTAENDAMTLAAWINWEGKGHSREHQGIFGKRLGWNPPDHPTTKWFWETQPDGDLVIRNGGAGVGWSNGLIASYPNEWIHVALTWDDGVVVQYINGEEVGTGNITFRDTADDTPMTIGCTDSTSNETFVGSIDEARIYNLALRQAEIQTIMLGEIQTASSPVPADGASHFNTWVILSWSLGSDATSNDVYFGDNFDNVNNGTGGTFKGNQVETSFRIGSAQSPYLVPGKTYYWRIDGVNELQPNSPWKGDVWSFTVRETLVLDDFEDGDLVSENYCAWRVYAWAANNDGEVLVFENVNAGGSSANHAAHARIRAGTGNWAGAQIALEFFWVGSLLQHKQYVDYGYDLRGFEAIRFRAKAIPGGSCRFEQRAGIPDYQHYYKTLTLTNAWREFVIPFSELNSNQSAVSIEESLQHTLELAFVMFPIKGTTVELWIDDIELVLRPGNVPPAQPELPSGLKEAAESRDLNIGFAMSPHDMGDDAFKNVIDKNSHFIIPGSGIAMSIIREFPHYWDFAMGDSVVKWAHDHGKKVKGGHLVWHHSTPEWLINGDYTSAEVDSIMKEFIQQTIVHYKTEYPNTITHWCVLNEGIDGSTRSYRETFWYNKLGKEYIEKAFRYAREADPDGKLYYNDYSIDWVNAKSNAVYNMIVDLLDKGVPIDGIGLQMHIWDPAGFPGKQSILENINRFGRLGLEVYITETDVVLNNDLQGLTQEKLDRQAEIYREIIKACLESPYYQDFACWGITDKYSWIVWSRDQDDWPLILDEWYQPKPAWNAIMATLTAESKDLEDFETGDFTTFDWRRYDDENWTVTSEEKNSGRYSARSGSIGDEESSALSIRLDCISGDISFYRKVSSERDCDYLEFYIDGARQEIWSGEKDWAQVSFPVEEGTRNFEWIYSKDSSISRGSDTAWIDDIVFPME